MASDAQDGPASLRQSRAGTAAAGDNSSKTPNTPLRRISRGSLSALSASRGADSAGPALAHLAPAFAELADSVEDLAVNMEGLDAVCQSLADFNEAFAGLLFGLRMNAYTSDFHQAPTIRNFDYNKQRAERIAQQELEEQAQAAFEHHQQQQQQQDAYDQDPEDAHETHNRTAYNANDTFISQPGDADMLRANKAAHGGARGWVSHSARGGRGGASTAASSSKAAAAKKRKQLLDFAHPIIQTLPIDFRERQPQRSDAESIIGSLRAHPEGLRMQDFVKQLPLIPQHRINDCLLALVRAKHAIKMTSKGLLYRLDPTKYPPQPQ